jgi:hypothetical protein
MALLLIALLFSSCSPKPVDHNNVLPRYSDIGKEEDAMNAWNKK